MNKEYIIGLFVLIIPTITYGQVGINTSNPNPNSLIHISETDDSLNKDLRGFMIPRLTNSERDELTYEDPLANPSVVKLLPSDNSLMIFNTTENCFNYWNSSDSSWKSLCGNTGSEDSGGNDGHLEFTKLPYLTYLSIADNLHEGYSWGADYPSRLEAMRTPSNFGANGIVRSNGFKPFIVPSTTSNNIPEIGYAPPTIALDLLTSELSKPSTTRKIPDIIFYSAYATRGVNSTVLANFIRLLGDYVNKGGVLIYSTNDNDVTHTNSLISELFGSQYATAYASNSNDDIYPINNLVEDPIVNGLFGNSAGEYWGEDNSGTIFMATLPPNSVQIANSNGLNQGVSSSGSVVWYNKDKNFFYFGDTVGTGGNTSNSSYPSHFIGNSPIPKIYGGTKKRNVYNSILEMNAIYWAGTRAKNNGINTHE